MMVDGLTAADTNSVATPKHHESCGIFACIEALLTRFSSAVDASEAGEGNLEITISARGHNIPTQVHPQGNARFAVSFVPLEATDHVISINFNKEPVPGSPFMARVAGDAPHHITVAGPSLSSAAVGKTSYFSINNVGGSVEDIEVNVEGEFTWDLGGTGLQR